MALEKHLHQAHLDATFRGPCRWKPGDASLAQLVEQRILNPRVVGSIPTGGTTTRRGATTCGDPLHRVGVRPVDVKAAEARRSSSAREHTSRSVMLGHGSAPLRPCTLRFRQAL